MPCCDKTRAYQLGTMFTGAARMECKVLATQLALLRWQIHQQPWAIPPAQAATLGEQPNNTTTGVGYNVLISSATDGPTPAARNNSGLAGVMGRLHAWKGRLHEGSRVMLRGLGALPMTMRRRHSKVTAARRNGTASQPQPELPSLAALRAERVADQQLRDQLRGTIVLRCGRGASCSCCATTPIAVAAPALPSVTAGPIVPACFQEPSRN